MSAYVADASSKLNAYKIDFTPQDPDCDPGQVITGDLNQNASVEVDIDRKCAFDVYLSYGYAPDSAGAGPAPSGTTSAGADDADADADAGAGMDDTGAGAGLFAYDGAGGVGEYLDATCATIGCHAAGGSLPDLSTFAVITSSPTAITDSIAAMGPGATLLMPVGGSAAANAAGIALLQGWVDAGYPESAAALALTNVSFETAYYESEPIELSKSILETHDLLTLKFKLCTTADGEAAGFNDTNIKCIQGGSYSRTGSSSSDSGGAGSGDTGSAGMGSDGAGAGDADGAGAGDADGGAAGGAGNEIVGDPNSLVNFDAVQDLFITNPANPAVAGCTAMGCHGEAEKGQGATTDYSTYQNIVDAENASPGIIMQYAQMGLMPKGAPYGAAELQLIANWIAGGMLPGADAALIPDPNAVVTAQVAALVGNSCTGCHGAMNGNGGVQLLGDANLKQFGMQSLVRVEAAAAGMADPMPPNINNALSADQIQMIRTWVEAGMPDVAPLISPDAVAQ